MKWLPIAAKFPKWAVTGALIIGTIVVFIGWSLMRGAGDAGPQDSAASSAGPAVGKPEFEIGHVLLCGNTLIDFDGEILARQWLEGFGDSQPQILKLFPEEKIVVVANRGQAVGFGFNGKAKPALTVDGKPVGAAAFSTGDSRVVYVREGNLWVGDVDWLSSTLKNAKRITDTGIFRDDTFRGAWFWSGNNLFVSVLGRTHRVELDSGRIQPDSTNISAVVRGASPDGKASIHPMAFGQVVRFDFQQNTVTQHASKGELKQVCWLGNDRAALLGSFVELAIYDRSKDKITGRFECGTQMPVVASNTPDGNCLLLGTNRGPMLLDVTTGKFTPVPLPMEAGAWVSNDAMICSNTTTDSEKRGLWLVKRDGSSERLSNQPFDMSGASGAVNPVVQIPSGALFISGGNLWRFDGAKNSLRQLTQGEKLVTQLKLLAP